MRAANSRPMASQQRINTGAPPSISALVGARQSRSVRTAAITPLTAGVAAKAARAADLIGQLFAAGKVIGRIRTVVSGSRFVPTTTPEQTSVNDPYPPHLAEFGVKMRVMLYEAAQSMLRSKNMVLAQ